MVACQSGRDSDRVAALENGGCQIIPLDSADRVENMRQIMKWCYDQGMTNVMTEAGAGVLGALTDADLIDEFQVFVAPKVVGGRNAISPIAGGGLPNISSSAALEPLNVESIDGDLLITTRRKSIE